MNCTEIEKDIYLYDELPTSERAIVDAHITQCDSCKELLAVLQIHQSVIQRVAQQKPQPENFSRLTSSIMRAIDTPANQNVFSKFFGKLFVRYSLAAASLALIMLFVFEYTVINAQVQSPVVTASLPKTVTLKTSGTLENVRKKKEKKEEPSLYACVKNGDCSSSFVENFKKKSL